MSAQSISSTTLTILLSIQSHSKAVKSESINNNNNSILKTKRTRFSFSFLYTPLYLSHTVISELGKQNERGRKEAQHSWRSISNGETPPRRSKATRSITTFCIGFSSTTRHQESHNQKRRYAPRHAKGGR